jgi:hypothetical protein
VASAWILGLGTWVITTYRSPWHLAALLAATLGLALVSLLEAGIYSRLPPSPDPTHRFTLNLLLILVAKQLLYIPGVLQNPNLGRTEDFLRPLAYVGGQATAFLVVAWGMWANQRWSAWVGTLLTGALAVETLWSYRSHLIGRSPSFLLFAHYELPRLVVHVAVAALLGARAWKARRQNVLTK